MVVGIDPEAVPSMVSAAGKAVLFIEGIEASPALRIILTRMIPIRCCHTISL